MISGVYQIKNKTNGHIYIGSAINIKNRFQNHKKVLRKNTHHSNYLQNAWNKYGENSFDFQTLILCDKQNCILFEQMFIDGYRPEYNICKVAGSTFGFRFTDESKAKISAKAYGNTRKLGHKLSDETKKKLSIAKLGKSVPPFSEEHRQKIGEANSRRILSDETKRKISNSLIGYKHDDEFKEKVSKFQKGRPKSMEMRRKLSESKKLYWAEWRKNNAK